MAIERRVDRDRRPGRRQAAHRAQPQRPGRHGHGAVRPRARAAQPSRRSTSCSRCSSRWPRRTWTGRCPATRTCSAPSPSTSSHHLLAYFWMFRARRPALPVRARGDGRAAARRRRPRRRELPHRPARWWPPSWGSRRSRRTRSTPSPTATSCSTSCRRRPRCATHLSRLGAEIVLWSSEEFGFAEVSDAWASGSSIMPQKKNPDAAELLRAKAPRVVSQPGGAARRPARPPADLQQGHAGGQGGPLRRGRHPRGLPRGRHRHARDASPSGATGWPRRPRTR